MIFAFDSNFPPRFVEALATLGIEARHVAAELSPLASDAEWIAASKENGWIVITAESLLDKRSHRHKTFRDAGVPVLFVSPAVLRRGLLETLGALICEWRAITDTFSDARRSNCYALTRQGIAKR